MDTLKYQVFPSFGHIPIPGPHINLSYTKTVNRNLVSDVEDQTELQPQIIIQDTTSFNLALIPIVRNRDRVHAAESLSHTHKRNDKIKH